MILNLSLGIQMKCLQLDIHQTNLQPPLQPSPSRRLCCVPGFEDTHPNPKLQDSHVVPCDNNLMLMACKALAEWLDWLVALGYCHNGDSSAHPEPKINPVTSHSVVFCCFLFRFLFGFACFTFGFLSLRLALPTAHHANALHRQRSAGSPSQRARQVLCTSHAGRQSRQL